MLEAYHGYSVILDLKESKATKVVSSNLVSLFLCKIIWSYFHDISAMRIVMKWKTCRQKSCCTLPSYTFLTRDSPFGFAFHIIKSCPKWKNKTKLATFAWREK